jgi:hypothetical protein
MVVQSSGSCINVDNSSGLSGYRIDQWTCAGGVNQNFVFTPTADGYYTIQPQNDNLCLDAGSGSVTTAVQVVQNPCSGIGSQKWKVQTNNDGFWSIITYGGAGCLDVYAGRTANGTALTTYACHGASNEDFAMAGFRPAAVSPPATAFVSTMVIQSSGSCVDVNGGSAQAGFGLDQWTCSGSSNQSFAFAPTADGYYNIKPQNDGLCVDAGSGSVTTGIQIVQNPCSGQLSQKWRLIANLDGTQTISTPDGTGCFDVFAGRTANGTIVTTYACHNSSNESFTVPGLSSGGSQTAAPTIFPAAGTYTPPLPVTIAPAMAGTPVFYTTDGTTPSASSLLYSSPISLTSSTTVKAIAVARGSTASSVASSAFTIQQPQTPPPTISPGSGTYTSPLSVTISPAVAGTPIYYTIDSSTPTTSSKVYTGPFSLTASTTVKAIAVASGSVASSVVSGAFTVQQPKTPPPTISPGAGTYTSPLAVTIVPAVAGTPIYYTIDSSTPTTSSKVYTGPFSLTASTTVKAIAVAIGSTASSVVSSAFNVQQPKTPPPAISPGAGTYTSPLAVTIVPAVAGTPVYYMIDGTTPSASSLLYSGPIPLTSSATVKAIAVTSGSTASSVVSSAFTLTSVGPSTTPIIFNYSKSSRPGDVIYVQGVNFDATSQVMLGSTAGGAGSPLSVINRVGTTWLAAQLPQSWSGAMFLWVSNSSGSGSPVALNGAIPFHLDALQINPGGAFRVLGRNLMMAPYTPSITLDGQAATINFSASSENMLVATAPAQLSSTFSSVILVNNGNGTGAKQLDRTIRVVAGSGDPLGLGVGWAAGFTFAGHTVAVITPCNGTSDDSANIQSAINTASSSGAIVALPAGTCRLASSLTMRSNVVLQGAGKTATLLRYESNYPISSQGQDLVGLRNLTLVNAGSAAEGLIWQSNTRSFFQNVAIQEGVSRQLFLTGNLNFVVMQTDFTQGGSIGGQNPYLLTNCGGLVFTSNTSVTVDGSPTFSSVHDALFLNNHFSRSSANQNEAAVITTHQFVMDFQYRTSIIGNTFDVISGPVTNTTRNDGETLLTEGGGGNRTENLGTVGSATANSLTDTSNVININPFGTGLPENYGVAIVSGTGAGQTREVVGYANGTMVVDHAWDLTPDSTSRYATFVWGLEKTLIEGNTLVGNPRGIWLYQTAVRDVDISGNTIVNGGGIFLRTFENQSGKQFDPMYNIRVANNNVGNSDGVWMSYLDVVFVNQDPLNFGTADTGIEIRGNQLTPNTPNVQSGTEDYNSREGFMSLMRSGTSGGKLTQTPMVLGTILQSNQCSNCSTAFVIGTGDYGTVLSGNIPAFTSPQFLSDWQTLGSGIVGSVGTIIR